MSCPSSEGLGRRLWLDLSPLCLPTRDIEIFALFVSCMCHDLDHRGTNNSFQVASVRPCPPHSGHLLWGVWECYFSSPRRGGSWWDQEPEAVLGFVLGSGMGDGRGQEGSAWLNMAKHLDLDVKSDGVFPAFPEICAGCALQL